VVWIQILAGVVLLVTPLNMRFQLARTRTRVAAERGDIERFDRFQRSRLVRGLYIGVPAVGVVLIVLGLLGA
jgi:hypothetical protein